VKANISIALSVIALIVGIAALIKQPFGINKANEPNVWVHLDPWPIETFDINHSKEKCDSPSKKLSIELINGASHNLRCFIQVESKGFGVGASPNKLYRVYVSPVIELASVNTVANRNHFEMSVAPSEEDICGPGSIYDFYLDIKVVGYESRKIFFHRRCYYFLAVEGDENLHLHRPVELHPSDDERFKDCQCIPKSVRNK
jgi:hypothetical protein